MIHAVIYPDNRSAILLDKNGSKPTKHIKMKYLFVTNKIERGEVMVTYKPIEEMWINMNMKPKMGRPYKVNLREIMSCPIDFPASISKPM